MATLERCIEGHAFDRAASETCQICGSTVWKKQPVAENTPPRDRATEAADVFFSKHPVVASLFVVVVGATWLVMVYRIEHYSTEQLGRLLKLKEYQSVIENVAERIHDAWVRSYPTPPPRTDEEIRRLLKKKLGEGKFDDTNTASQPITAKEIPNPFDPEPRNPLDPKTRFDPK